LFANPLTFSDGTFTRNKLLSRSFGSQMLGDRWVNLSRPIEELGCRPKTARRLVVSFSGRAFVQMGLSATDVGVRCVMKFVSPHTYKRPRPRVASNSARLATVWLHEPLKQQYVICAREKREPRNSKPGYEIKRAEGTGLEPATGYPAPHIQSPAGVFRSCPNCVSRTRSRSCATGPRPRLFVVFANVRALGYRLATRSN
jgi:hypothetical protein